MPKISIVCATYNHGKYLRQTIPTVLNQTFTDFEFIISDDCSTDDSLAILDEFKDPRIQVIRNSKNLGITGNLWRCWERVTGEYLSGFTTDDQWQPTFLAELIAELEATPKLSGVFALADFINEEGVPTGEKWTEEGVGLDRFALLRSIWNQRPIFCSPAQMVRIDAYRNAGFVPRNYMQINDLVAYINLLRDGDLKIIPKYLARFRQRADNKNASAPTFAALDRFAVEMYYALFEFQRAIKDVDMLLAVFPEAAAYCLGSPENETRMIIRYSLARLALDFPHPAYRMYALTVLHELLSDDRAITVLLKRFDFGFSEFFKLAGESAVLFGPHLLGEFNHLKEKTKHDNFRIQQLESEAQMLRNRVQELEECDRELRSSTSWRITAPLRTIRESLARKN